MGDLKLSSKFTIEDIPVRNLWLLMAYANIDKPILHRSNTGYERPVDNLPELVADLLSLEVARRFKSGLSVSYISRLDELTRVKGKIIHLANESKNSLARGKVTCNYEVMTQNTIENQLVRLALDLLSSMVSDGSILRQVKYADNLLSNAGVDKTRKSQMGAYLRKMSPNSRDVRMLDLAKLAIEMTIPLEIADSKSLYVIERQENWLRTLFEKAIEGFYSYHLKPEGWQVGARKMNWQISDSTSNFEKLLPGMKTDIELFNANKNVKVIIDTKFNAITAFGKYEQETFRSGYVYQMYSYIRSQEETESHLSEPVRGILLHPATGSSVYEEATIQGHKLVFATVDLMKDSMSIKQELLALVS